MKPSKGRYGAGTRLRKQVRVWGPKRECARRPERFINTRSYQILDTCARLRGRVLSAERSGSNVVIKVLIGSNVTRRIWRDYPRSAEVYAVGLTRVRGMARLRAGDKIKVSGALVRSRSSNTLSMAPVSYVRSRR